MRSYRKSVSHSELQRITGIRWQPSRGSRAAGFRSVLLLFAGGRGEREAAGQAEWKKLKERRDFFHSLFGECFRRAKLGLLDWLYYCSNLLFPGDPEQVNSHRMSNFLLPMLTRKKEVDTFIRDTLEKVLVLRFGDASQPECAHLDDILYKSSRAVSRFATIALVDSNSEELQVYIKYFDISVMPSAVFFFNAHHMKMDSGSADHTKWVGSFYTKQDFIDVVEVIFRGAMKGKMIVTCPLPPERIPRFQLLYKGV
ncbi:hypothetical protein Taro_000422 [Colocasia esculenta]|uniref:Thioredoxin-like protein 4B n=1 Tax=Colocasia esculenta TaxID=4460 RepID=A0A843TD43_COLES|nr:hypothetical protein [Colocasia esculenta]